MTLTRTLVASITTLLVAAFALPVAAADGRGEQLFELCAQCHGSAAEGNQMTLAPAIAGLDEWYVEAQLNYFRNGARGLHPGDTGGMRMYPMSIWLSTDEDVKAVAGYVASLPRANPTPVLEGGDAAKGSAFYLVCATCHGQEGGGDPEKNSPPLRGANDWYLLSSLEKYKAKIRGGSPLNPNAVVMQGTVNILPDAQAMRDVVAHIMTLSE
ncbi:MAG: cytochrome c [Deltaproteobacteria bacterium]|nr:cytochrome c [Deltaproteobacteria bacterium]MBW2395539.1 cytochrome c [Deltaproteobacteria bacterium]